MDSSPSLDSQITIPIFESPSNVIGEITLCAEKLGVGEDRCFEVSFKSSYCVVKKDVFFLESDIQYFLSAELESKSVCLYGDEGLFEFFFENRRAKKNYLFSRIKWDLDSVFFEEDDPYNAEELYRSPFFIITFEDFAKLKSFLAHINAPQT